MRFSFSSAVSRSFVARLAAVLGLALVTAFAASSQTTEQQVDTALIVAVDVSNSVDQTRYKLQMEGIAKALEDPEVIAAIAGGPNGGILFSMVTWSDKPIIALPWTRISNKDEARDVAMRVRRLPLQGGEFTCMTRMLRSANDKIVPQIPGKPMRVVIDVSGDGKENCNPDEPIEKVRDELVASGVTVNGLPILEGAGTAAGPVKSDESQETLEDWFKAKVMGGPAAFVLPANGYADFGRAIRQKFVIEISGVDVGRRHATANEPAVR
jgi:hypothetical protein